MSQATPYARTTGFADDERDNVGGRATVLTAHVDFELDAIAVAVNQTIANLAVIQRDDQVLRDGIVPVSALDSATLKLISSVSGNIRGAWATATAYAVKDVVTQSGNTYIAVTAHTSGTFATDLTAVRWILIQIGANPNAATIPFSPTANVTATNTQAAISEVDTKWRAGLAAEVATLAASAQPTDGAGGIGFLASLAYGAGTVGRWLKDLATSAGASLIGFLPAGTGASLTNLQARCQLEVWASDYGHATAATAAVNDAAILAAIVYVSGQGGGTVRLARGNFNHVSIAFNPIIYPNVSIRGSGKSGTTLTKFGATTTPVLDITASGLAQVFATYSDFAIVGSSTCSGLRTTLIALFTLRDILISGSLIGWENNGSLIAETHALDLRGNAKGYISSRVLSGGSYIYPNLIKFNGGQIINNSVYGFDIVHGMGVTWDSVDIELNGTTASPGTSGGIVIRSTTTLEYAFGNFTVCGNTWFEGNHGAPLAVESATGLILTVGDAKFFRLNTADTPVAMNIGTIEACTLNNCLAVSSLSGGMTTTVAASRSIVHGGTYTTLTDNSFSFTHSQVATFTEYIRHRMGGTNGLTSQFDDIGLVVGSQATLPGIRIAKKQALNGATGTITLPIAFNVGGGAAWKVFIGGADSAAGACFAREYLVATQVGGGGAPPFSATLVGTTGSTTPTFTFSTSGGLLTLSVASGNLAQVYVIGG